MIENVVLQEEDFLQQFPGNEQYTQEGMEFVDWWDAGEDPIANGEPVNIAAIFGGSQA